MQPYCIRDFKNEKMTPTWEAGLKTRQAIKVPASVCPRLPSGRLIHIVFLVLYKKMTLSHPSFSWLMLSRIIVLLSVSV